VLTFLVIGCDKEKEKKKKKHKEASNVTLVADRAVAPATGDSAV
jgi:hypothetical protein